MENTSVHFHLPDFTHNFHLNLLLFKLMETYPEAFYEGIDIGSVYGEFPPSVWNGGRCIGGIFPEHEMRYVVDELNKRGISLRYTFTNPLIGKAHLKDGHCNRCLQVADRADGMNGVILVSQPLEEYIRREYPNYRIISSTCKQITDFDAICEELEQDYALVVLDYNLNNNWEFLERLPHKEKVEILVNAVCEPACPRRRDHYQYLGRMQIGFCEHLRKNGTQAPYQNPEEFSCPHMGKMLYDTTGYSTHVSPQDIYEKYVPMGFRNFKIEGRAAYQLNVMETYMYYMVKPEHRDRIRLLYLLSLQHNKILSYND